jgi:hypothetical protein
MDDPRIPLLQQALRALYEIPQDQWADTYAYCIDGINGVGRNMKSKIRARRAARAAARAAGEEEIGPDDDVVDEVRRYEELGFVDEDEEGDQDYDDAEEEEEAEEEEGEEEEEPDLN